MLKHNLPLDDKSISRLSKKGLSLKTLKDQLNEELDTSLELFRLQGLNIVKHEGYYYFDTRFIPIEEAEFCIVDIETNGSKIEKHQIIEIAAVKVHNGKIIDRFDSLVHTKQINPAITEITGIKVEDTKDAPDLKTVLEKFKEFLGNAIFVAHDVKFDYLFTSKSMEKVGLPALLNRSLCSLALAERTIVSYRYALSYLNDSLNLNPNAQHHRAMSDVLTTYGLFLLSLENLNEDIKTVEDLINFSKEASRLKRPKFDPLAKKEETE
ncbi:3'-5' exonuclease [Sulfurimonas sp. C5]|uniref:3'-5' exonuclease n=1 Tax=Sulfurimonas sp. C5 TaxID=3036947 RepID=UPI0024586F28|nr:3'-5' exonuclease [Sulfurimonas sp. C5]MDH4945009.1 3'-5' exonuclease [Sulfurimonas sp. C5]